jgi:DNA-binding protein YbaB
VNIDLSLITPQDAGRLEELMVAALRNAKSNAEATVQAKIQELNSGSPQRNPIGPMLS